jgi:hypothetical protein
MSIFKKNPRLFGSSVQSSARRINSTIGNLACATVLAGFILCGGAAKAQNEILPGHVLLNPGAENGLTNWNVSLTGYINTVSTNSLINGAGSGNVLAHSGGNVFRLFDTTADQAYIYQDIAADPGSQWSATCYAICYASNYFQAGASADMQVSFYDATNGLLSSSNAVNQSAGNVYGSDFLDPVLEPGYWMIIPPMAVDASGWVSLQATNIYDTDPAQEASFESTNPTAILYAPPGTAKVRYMLEYTNTVTGGGAVYFDDCDLVKLVGSDPDITNQSGALTIYAGLPATFTVNLTWHYKAELAKLSCQWQKNGTNLPAGGGIDDISGNTTNEQLGVSTLSLTNCVAADAGLYDCVITDITTNTPPITNSIRSVPVPLTVLTLSPLQKVNALGANSGFESDPVWAPWNIFNGANFATANNFYGTSSNAVNVYDGNSVALVGANGDRDNGFWQAVPATRGSIWKAGGFAYISSSNDFNAGNTERIQVWFNDVNGVAVPGTPTFESFKLYGLAYTNSDAQYVCIDTTSPNNGQTLYHTQLPRDQWVYLPVSNVVNNAGVDLTSDLPYTTFSNGDFTVPTNSTVAEINFQVYELVGDATDVASNNLQSDLIGTAADAVYWDDMQLIQVVPPTNFTATVSGHNVNLSFAGQAGLDFAVLYKTNLTDATWSVLTNNVIAPLSWQTNVNYGSLPSNNVGTFYYPITATDTVTATSRFYKLQAQ